MSARSWNESFPDEDAREARDVMLDAWVREGYGRYEVHAIQVAKDALLDAGFDIVRVHGGQG